MAKKCFYCGVNIDERKDFCCCCKEALGVFGVTGIAERCMSGVFGRNVLKRLVSRDPATGVFWRNGRGVKEMMTQLLKRRIF